MKELQSNIVTVFFAIFWKTRRVLQIFCHVVDMFYIFLTNRKRFEPHNGRHDALKTGTTGILATDRLCRNKCR
jgi:hypothetical protein